MFIHSVLIFIDSLFGARHSVGTEHTVLNRTAVVSDNDVKVGILGQKIKKYNR